MRPVYVAMWKQELVRNHTGSIPAEGKANRNRNLQPSQTRPVERYSLPVEETNRATLGNSFKCDVNVNVAYVFWRAISVSEEYWWRKTGPVRYECDN